MANWFNMIPADIWGEEPKKKPSNFVGNTGGIGVGQPRQTIQTNQGIAQLHSNENLYKNANGTMTVNPKVPMRGVTGFAAGGTFTPLGAPEDPNKVNAAAPIGSAVAPQTDINAGMSTIRDMAAGKSAVSGSIANQTMSNFGGANQAAIGAQKQEAAQAGLGREAIGAIGQTATRNAEGERTKLMGQLATDAGNRQQSAAGTLIQAGQTERTYKDTSNDAAWQRALETTDATTAEGLASLQQKYTELYGGTAPDLNKIKGDQAYTKQKQDMDIEATRLNIDSTKMNDVVNAVNSGSTLEQINSTYGTNMTQAQFDSMRAKYSQSLVSGNLANDAAKLNISGSQMTQAITAINNGLTDAAKINAQTGLNLTQDQVNAMAENYSTETQAKKLGLQTSQMSAIISNINSGMPLDKINQTYGTSLTQSQYDNIAVKYNQSIDAGQIANDAAKFGLTSSKMSAVVTAINSGATLDQINSTFGTTITADQFESMQKQYQQKITSNDINNASAQFNVDSQKLNAAIVMANNGMDVDTANKKLGTSFTPAQWSQIQKQYSNTMMTAETQLAVMKQGLEKGTYDLLQTDINNGMDISEIKGKDYNGDGKPDFPNLSDKVYTAMGRDHAIQQETSQQHLETLKTQGTAANWMLVQNKIAGHASLSEVRKIPGYENMTQDEYDAINKDNLEKTNDKKWAEALQYNDISTPEGLTAIKTAWTATHPGQDVPDFKVLQDQRTEAVVTARTNTIATSGKASDALIGDIIDNSATPLTSSNLLTSDTYKNALNNSNLRKSIAQLVTSNGLDNAANASIIDENIKERMLSYVKGDVQKLVDGFVANDRVPKDFQDTPDWQGQLKRAIQDMVNGGQIDSNGNPTAEGSGDLPWVSPNTYFNYTDWNGGDIKYDNSGSKAAGYGSIKVSIAGNGTQYTKMVNGTKMPITFADMDSAWSNLSPSQKAQYFTDTGFDTEGFINDHITTSKSADGTGTVLSNAQDRVSYLGTDKGGTDLSAINAAINGTATSPGFRDTSTYAGSYQAGQTYEGGREPGKPLSGNGEYSYYNEDGILSYGRTDDQSLKQVWLQFSQYFNNGKVMTSEEFQNRWNNGKGWYVDDSGNVMNFQNSFQTKYGVSGQALTVDVKKYTGSVAGTTAKTVTADNVVSMAGTSEGLKSVVDAGVKLDTGAIDALKKTLTNQTVSANASNQVTIDNPVRDFNTNTGSGMTIPEAGKPIMIGGKVYIVTGTKQLSDHKGKDVQWARGTNWIGGTSGESKQVYQNKFDIYDPSTGKSGSVYAEDGVQLNK